MIDLTDRRGIFYWQTDRNLSAEDYREIFLKRQEVPDSSIVKILKEGIQSIRVDTIEIVPPDENVVKGNVNIVRKIVINGQSFLVRLHPFGVKNGYFYVEKVASDLALKKNLPAPEVVEIHEAVSEKDMDFMLVKVLPGITMDVLLSKDKTLENSLLKEAGNIMAKIHKIKVDRFGAFNNEIAKSEGRLVGLHSTYKEFVHTGLKENLERLQHFEIIDDKQAHAMGEVFEKNNFEPVDGARLVHNDFADWNLLVDRNKISGVLDWDECHGGDPIADLACWSTFFNMDRFELFLEGYKEKANLPKDFEKRFHFYRLRYTISKMALRIKRYQVDQQQFIKDKLEVGKKALAEELSLIV